MSIHLKLSLLKVIVNCWNFLFINPNMAYEGEHRYPFLKSEPPPVGLYWFLLTTLNWQFERLSDIVLQRDRGSRGMGGITFTLTLWEPPMF